MIPQPRVIITEGGRDTAAFYYYYHYTIIAFGPAHPETKTSFFPHLFQSNAFWLPQSPALKAGRRSIGILQIQGKDIQIGRRASKGKSDGRTDGVCYLGLLLFFFFSLIFCIRTQTPRLTCLCRFLYYILFINTITTTITIITIITLYYTVLQPVLSYKSLCSCLPSSSSRVTSPSATYLILNFFPEVRKSLYTIIPQLYPHPHPTSRRCHHLPTYLPTRLPITITLDTL